MLKEKIALVLSCIPTTFVAHYVDEWSPYICILEKEGRAMCSTYWYEDEPLLIYLSDLSVSESARKLGLGTQLQKIHEDIAKQIGATTSCLHVGKTTWMHEWYQRLGYIDQEDHNEVEGAVWMKKEL